MDYAVKRELESIKSELHSIINDLNSISEDVRADFDGIGNENCAAGIGRVAGQYQWVKQNLNNID